MSKACVVYVSMVHENDAVILNQFPQWELIDYKEIIINTILNLK